MSLFPYSPLLAQAAAAAPDGLYDIVVLQPERPLWPLVVFLAIALLLIGGIVWLVLYLLRNRHGKTPAATALASAIRRLDQLERGHDELGPNQFALGISETIKDLLSVRFSDPVRYETTEELLARLEKAKAGVPPLVRQELREFLTAAEEVKFANRPDAIAHTRPLMRMARQIISLCQAADRAEQGRA